MKQVPTQDLAFPTLGFKEALLTFALTLLLALAASQLQSDAGAEQEPTDDPLSLTTHGPLTGPSLSRP